jgi:hypothetical protein
VINCLSRPTEGVFVLVASGRAVGFLRTLAGAALPPWTIQDPGALDEAVSF